jgi:SAM-dependent methyltransferase
MVSSRTFYDALASNYDALFEAPHRRAYDQLAWELVLQQLPRHAASIVDAGCGTGRWASRLVELGHSVIGVEESPTMAGIALRRVAGERFRLIEASMDRVRFAEPVDVVLAMGSLQYTQSPERTLSHMASWLRPGGRLVVLVDSLMALAVELLAAGKHEEAQERVDGRVGQWIVAGRGVQQHLFDMERLESALAHAGLTDVETWGLLVGSSALGLAGLTERLRANWECQLSKERRWSRTRALADLGKQLLGAGRRA